MSAPRREKSLYVTPCRGRVAAVSRPCRKHVATWHGRVAAMSRACRNVSRPCRGHCPDSPECISSYQLSGSLRWSHNTLISRHHALKVEYNIIIPHLPGPNHHPEAVPNVPTRQVNAFDSGVDTESILQYQLVSTRGVACSQLFRAPMLWPPCP
jgi:hypothetical protein